MKSICLLLCLWSLSLWARPGYVDKNETSTVTPEESEFYAFDSTFKFVLSQNDLELKVRLSKFEFFSHSHKKLSGEMVNSQGKFFFMDSFLSNLLMEDLKGEISLTRGKIENSEFKGGELSSLMIRDTRIQHTNFIGFMAQGATFRDVVFSETNFQGVSLPGLNAENVKFIGRTGALNLRGCYLKNVEFYFDRLQYLSLAECYLENVTVNGKKIIMPIILKGE